jgi:hypothetical protein
MARKVSMYEPYWQLIKKNRGKRVELLVPADYQERVIKALRKRKTLEMNNSARVYPDFIIEADGKADVMYVTLPLNPIDTI